MAAHVFIIIVTLYNKIIDVKTKKWILYSKVRFVLLFSMSFIVTNPLLAGILFIFRYYIFISLFCHVIIVQWWLNCYTYFDINIYSIMLQIAHNIRYSYIMVVLSSDNIVYLYINAFKIFDYDFYYYLHLIILLLLWCY